MEWLCWPGCAMVTIRGLATKPGSCVPWANRAAVRHGHKPCRAGLDTQGWWGITKPKSCGINEKNENVDLIEPREAYYRLQARFAAHTRACLASSERMRSCHSGLCDAAAPASPWRIAWRALRYRVQKLWTGSGSTH